MEKQDLTNLFYKFQRERSRVRQWQARVMAEADSHAENCMCTLTYDEFHLPPNGSFNIRDFQLFMKSLRERLAPRRIRFFGCAEYGSKGLRPHYHLIIFGWCPRDLTHEVRTDKGSKAYRSEFLARVWKRGFISVSRGVDPREVPYFAKYCQKFQRLPKDLPRPRLLFSRRPGIGECALRSDKFIDWTNDKFYFAGRSVSIPRYYLKKGDEHITSAIKLKRQEWFKKYTSAEVEVWRENGMVMMNGGENGIVDGFIKKFENSLKSFEKWLTR